MVFSLSTQAQGYTGFLTYYSQVALPVQAVYYFLLVLCTVSVCDRSVLFNVMHLEGHCWP